MGKLGFDLLQFLGHSLKLTAHAVHVPQEGGQITSLPLPSVFLQQLDKLLDNFAVL